MRFTKSQLVVMWMVGFMAALLAVGMLGAHESTHMLGWALAGAILAVLLFATLFARRSV